MKKKVTCEIEVTLSVLNGKWKPLILYYLISDGTKRFSQVKRHIHGISHKTLTVQLRQLEEDKLIERKVYMTVPPQVEYTTTKRGESLYNILEAMCDWGYKNKGDEYELINPQCTGE
ncbi:helix-turn-helix domain-containing protein [uncultured Clostridium sp.]|jgi:DNA-binding HxlR family transcriptional regulator|uniref:winged helix-turn-helix transcriptional regulator n=1 Tax=uncultured Clostridium sp. TaxID=59620 RepID=UPI0026039D89|nr:helix-turn-helix domain-containing protein [uncultured Clostridium sp.]